MTMATEPPMMRSALVGPQVSSGSKRRLAAAAPVRAPEPPEPPKLAESPAEGHPGELELPVGLLGLLGAAGVGMPRGQQT